MAQLVQPLVCALSLHPPQRSSRIGTTLLTSSWLAARFILLKDVNLVVFVFGVDRAWYFAYKLVANWAGTSSRSQRAVSGAANEDVHV